MTRPLTLLISPLLALLLAGCADYDVQGRIASSFDIAGAALTFGASEVPPVPCAALTFGASVAHGAAVGVRTRSFPPVDVTLASCGELPALPVACEVRAWTEPTLRWATSVAGATVAFVEDPARTYHVDAVAVAACP